MKALALVVLLLLLSVSPAGADQNDPRLDPLFEALEDSRTLGEAQTYEARIWGLWLEHDDERVGQMMSVAGVAIGEGLLEAALSETDLVVERAPEYAEGWNRRATILYLLDRYEDSLDDIAQVLALEPRHFGALSGRGLCLMALGRYAEAEPAFLKALALHPHLPGAKRNLRYLRRKLGRPI